MEHHNPIPVNIVSGFLGAGKTTMVNYILSNWTEQRIDVLVREYGSVSVDDQLLKNVSGNVHIFPGVTVHDDPQIVLYDYLHDLYNNSEGDDSFEHLLIESSGLDMPESLVHLFMLGHMPHHYGLGSYIVLVDAEYGLLNLDEYEVAVHQVAFADVIILNKVDLADEASIQVLEERIRNINAMAPIYRASYGQVPLKDVMNIGLYDQLKNLQPKERTANVNEIQTTVLSESRPMDKAKVNDWITDLFEKSGPKILRSKGFFSFAGEDWRYEFQGVRKSFHSKTDRLWADGEERKSTVVLIGEYLPNQEDLQKSFSACVKNND